MAEPTTAATEERARLPILSAISKIELSAVGRPPIRTRPDRKPNEVLPVRLQLTYTWDPALPGWRTEWVVFGHRRLTANRWANNPHESMTAWHVDPVPDWIIDALQDHQPLTSEADDEDSVVPTPST